MDSLKDLLQKRKPAEKSWVKKADILEEQKKKYLEEQKQFEQKEHERKLQQLKERSELYRGDLENIEKIYEQGMKKLKDMQEIDEYEEGEKKKRKQQKKEDQEDHPDEEVPQSKESVIEELREIQQPVTLFGESDWKRYKRLLDCKENLKQLEENNVKGNFYKEADKDKKEYKMKMDKIVVDEEYLKKMAENKIKQNSVKDKKKNDDFVTTKISTEDKSQGVINWCNKMLKEWELKLNENYPTEAARKSRNGKQKFLVFKQCLEYIQPLFQLIKKKQVSDEILTSVYQISYHCLHKDYIKANDKYVDVAIGNAPWPMGVTQVGIHERAGRSKIFSSNIAHVLNDENSRKYLQSVKRLINVCQFLYPTDPSKTVNFSGECDLF